jgi:hypothetical protein
VSHFVTLADFLPKPDWPPEEPLHPWFEQVFSVYRSLGRDQDGTIPEYELRAFFGNHQIPRRDWPSWYRWLGVVDSEYHAARFDQMAADDAKRAAAAAKAAR